MLIVLFEFNLSIIPLINFLLDWKSICVFIIRLNRTNFSLKKLHGTWLGRWNGKWIYISATELRKIAYQVYVCRCWGCPGSVKLLWFKQTSSWKSILIVTIFIAIKKETKVHRKNIYSFYSPFVLWIRFSLHMETYKESSLIWIKWTESNCSPWIWKI